VITRCNSAGLPILVARRPCPIHRRDAPRTRLERRWGEIALTLVEVHIRAGLSVPVELGGGPIGTLEVYAADPKGWNQSEVSALQTHAGVVASLLGAAAKAGPWRSNSRSP